MSTLDAETAEAAKTIERRFPQQQLSLRISLWGALLTIHSVLLAIGFGLGKVDSQWTGILAQLFGWCAFLGLLSALCNITSSLAELRDALVGGYLPGTGTRNNWVNRRARVWVLLELFSLIMLSFCAAIMVLEVSNQ